MKKGLEYIGTVESVKFPNKGIVYVDEEFADTTDNPSEGGPDCGSTKRIKCVVKNVIKGQKIKLRVTKKRNGQCEGNLVEIIERSPLEVQSACPHFEVCGGCSYQTLPYEEQLKLKENQVHELLEPVICNNPACEGIDINDLFEPIKGSPLQFEYRNKMEFSFGDSCKDGELELGLHKSGSFYDIITVSKCRIIDGDFRKILSETLAYFRGKETPYYHKRTHEGFLRHLLVRKAAKTGEILVDLVTTSQRPQDTPCVEVSLMEDWVRAITELKLSGTVVGVLNTIDDKVADSIVNEHTDVLYGRDWFNEEILGLNFKITPFSFFQTNTLSAEVLYEKVREYVSLHNCANNGLHKVLFDLYSGTGTISQLMSTVADKVIAVEIVREAVEAAKENAERNGLHNCDFIAGDVLKVLDEIEEKPDFIILDPPRDGINPKALSKIIKYGVENIVYVSCKPSSLARDLDILITHGYIPKKICPIDQFPGTVHVETVVLLSRKIPDAVIDVELQLSELDLTKAESKATYNEIRNYVQNKYGFHVSNLNIAQVKRKHGIIEHEDYNARVAKHRVPGTPKEKFEAIEDALVFFKMI